MKILKQLDREDKIEFIQNHPYIERIIPPYIRIYMLEDYILNDIITLILSSGIRPEKTIDVGGFSLN